VSDKRVYLLEVLVVTEGRHLEIKFMSKGVTLSMLDYF